MNKMNSFERVISTLSFNEVDKAPLFLLLSLYGAKEMGINIKDYFENYENVIKMQIYMRNKYNTDCYYTFQYAAKLVQICGGEVVFYNDSPPNSGNPIITKFEDIKRFEFPEIKSCQILSDELKIISRLSECKDAPIISVVISPFSLPIMQLGFDKYLNILFNEKELFNELIRKNIEFCVEWANIQLEAGANAICYFDPMSSTTIIPRDVYLKTGYKIAKEVISRVNGPVATHFASGRVESIIDDVINTNSKVIGIGDLENFEEIIKKCENKITVLGNLNGIEMCSWDGKLCEIKVKEILSKAKRGFILSDGHGEIPYQVDEKILLKISEVVKDYFYTKEDCKVK